jgi:O-antigen ligase
MAQKNPEKFKINFLKSIVAAGTIPILIGVWQFITKTGVDIDEVSNRIYGTFAHPNVLATFTLVLLIVVAHEIITKQNKSSDFFDLKKDSPLKFLGLFLLFIIILTYTRIAWIGVALLAAIIGFIYYRKLLAYTLGIIILFYILFL